MSDFPRWKYALVVIVLLLGIVYALPNVFPPQPAVQISGNRGATVDAALKTKVEGILATAKTPASVIDVDEKTSRLLARFATADAQTKASDALRTTLGENYTVALNQASTVPAWLQSINAFSMPLGLDLQGGVHFLMEVDQGAVVDAQETRYSDDIRALLREKKVSYDAVNRNARGQGVSVVLRTDADRQAAATLIATDYPELTVADGAATGNRFILNAVIKATKLRELSQSMITQNLTTLRQRVNALGVSEPLIQQQGANQIVVELAGVQDTAEAKKIIGAVATLQYRAGLYTPQQAADAARSGSVPPDAKLYYGREGRPYLLSKTIIATGDELTSAVSGRDQQNGTPNVSVSLNSAGARKMQDFTNGNVGKPMAVLYITRTTDTKMVDGKEVKTPKITEEVINYANISSPFGKQFSTNGLPSDSEASELALLLRGGSLAVPIDIVGESVIGPSLGADNIDKGFKAVMLGLGLVLVAAAIYYKLFGLVADVALFFNLVLLIAVMSMIHVTLTMPGIAGIVLTLGMAIDANVLICERIREELRNGSSPLAAIRTGYDKAWATILDANVTHLLAALGLMTMGSGPIKGFGVTLFIGILTSMFTSVTVTHAITALIHGGRKLKTLSV
ncbi:protein-export membrane protein SecD [Luteibacter rhizovicinus DSM 16549]|uniref:Protein translocase subunit SecD n=1 Tax=Luteibacter rhizovicinus DSM 16549 TaxID=1440763 RepID=A0A0G9H1A7_9GAMM|nr:protein translocase subunit SecD [Luteibacter rhizovicinus]APG02939.1 protein-export membrane protein SecD [Luteibacter rhizovicinus DSM 16549]KLD63328.1 preprotein translocase subunit SecD [Luteibacter rhizovicinus DSM 16549]KLD76487.1 preprotein translocase subunit SecD [Xanthomonas hyacinthi DSM 19077]